MSTVIFYGPVFLMPYVESLSITFRLALSLYIALSTLLVVLIRYGGCEVVGKTPTNGSATSQEGAAPCRPSRSSRLWPRRLPSQR